MEPSDAPVLTVAQAWAQKRAAQVEKAVVRQGPEVALVLVVRTGMTARLETAGAGTKMVVAETTPDSN